MDRHTCYKEIHYNKMAHTSQHDKNMKYFVGAEILMLRIEDRKFQGIDHTADGVNDSAGQKPVKASPWESMKNRYECQDTQPAHGDVQYRRKPFGAGDPTAFQNHSQYGNCPYQCTQNISDVIMKNNETYRSVAACNHNENHHMIYFAETPVYFFCRIYGVIDSTGCIKQDHSKDKNA